MANVNGGLAPQNQTEVKKTNVKGILANVNLQKKFDDILGKKAQGFMASIANISTDKLRDVEPMSVINCALIAATLDLPIDPNLGHAWLVPFRDKGVKKAQFQMAAKGYIQLAQRSGQYKKINKGKVYKNQFKSWNPFTEDLEADFSIRGEGEVIGYFAYFELINGFTKTVFWYKEEIIAHAKKYSKSFSNGPWQTEFDKMAEKTVIKAMIKEYGPLSIEMQQAIVTDQATPTKEVDLNNLTNDLQYPDGNEAIDTEFTEVNNSENQEVNQDEFKDTPFEAN